MAGWLSRASTGVTSIYLSSATVDPSNGKIYAIWGYLSSNYVHKVYDPSLNTWTTLATPQGTHWQGSYVNFGTQNLHVGDGSTDSLAAHVYTISSNAWTTTTSMPAVRYNAVPFSIGSKIYLIGGSKSGGSTADNILVLDRSNSTWSTIAQGVSISTAWYGGASQGNLCFMRDKYLDTTTNTVTSYANSVAYWPKPSPEGTSTSAEFHFRPIAKDPYQGLMVTMVDSNSVSSAILGQIRATRDVVNSPYDVKGVPESASILHPLAGSIYDTYYVQHGQYIYSIGGSNTGSSPTTYSQAFYRYDLALTALPSNVTPASGATINNDLATLTATAANNGARTIVEWQFATDAAFTANVKTVQDEHVTSVLNTNTGEPVVGEEYVLSGSVTRKIYAGTEELFQGTWYRRARQRFGKFTTSWTASASFTVTHPPSSVLTFPANGVALAFGSTGDVTFQWTFSDTSESDNQTAFQLIVERNDDGTVLLDTGKTAGVTTRSYLWSMPATYKDLTLRWKVRTWDSDDVVGSYSAYNTFSMSDVPTINVTAPVEGSELATSQPTVQWTFTASGGRTQSKYRVQFFEQGTNSLVHDSSWITGTATTYTPPEGTITVGAFYVQVTAADAGGLEGSDSNNFTTDYVEPVEPVFTTSSSNYEASGYNLITWTDAGIDDAFVEWRVYRRKVGDTEWDKIHSNPDAATGTYEFRDYTAASGVAYEYIVVQAAIRFSLTIESLKTNPQTITGSSTQYWLIDVDDSSNNMLLPNVTADDFADEWEKETLLVIGRGRHEDRGTHYGYIGSLTSQLRGADARSKRLKLEDLHDKGTNMVLRNPFGDVWEVAMGDIDVKRVPGVGPVEMTDVTIPYHEVD